MIIVKVKGEAREMSMQELLKKFEKNPSKQLKGTVDGIKATVTKGEVPETITIHVSQKTLAKKGL